MFQVYSMCEIIGDSDGQLPVEESYDVELMLVSFLSLEVAASYLEDVLSLCSCLPDFAFRVSSKQRTGHVLLCWLRLWQWAARP